MMKFRAYKKELEEKKLQAQTMQELSNAVSTLKKKRDKYIEDARIAYVNIDMMAYKAKCALLKNVLFNLAQTQQMQTNFEIAKDLYEMQKLNKHFVSSFSSVMKKVNATCKSINVSKTEQIFDKALYNSTNVNEELKIMLQNNNVAFTSAVDSIADIDDDEISKLIKESAEGKEDMVKSTLADLEAEFLSPKTKEKEVEPEFEYVGGVKHQRKVEVKQSAPKIEEKDDCNKSPEDELLDNENESIEYEFKWDEIPTITFEDIAGLETVKELVKDKVLLPLQHPELLEGYETEAGGGLCLYGPGGTGKSMVAAAIAHEINAKFCEIKPSSLLRTGVGNTEKAIKQLFAEARSFPCAVIFFDEMDSIAPKKTTSIISRQLRSEFLAQLQGIEAYNKKKDNILFVVCATNKPWDIDSPFLRPGRFGTKIYVGLPDAPAREYMINRIVSKIKEKGIVELRDIDIARIVEATNGFNGSDVVAVMGKVQDISMRRAARTGEKFISMEDIEDVLATTHSSVQLDDIIKLKEWNAENYDVKD